MQLVMQAAQRSFARTGVVVLNERIGHPGRGEFRLIVTLQEKTAGVAKNVLASELLILTAQE
jgi:hypothetical protein